jgi:formiminotetrahydrofolate cyclodeaminase
MKKTESRLAERRAFLKKAGVAAATVPAAALLLSAQAKAQIAPSPSGGIIVDDISDTQ